MTLVCRNGRRGLAHDPRTDRRPGRGARRAGHDVTVEDGVSSRPRSSLHRAVARRTRPRTGLRRPARAPPDARPRGRGDDRLGHGGGRGGRLLRDRRDAEHRARRRHGIRPAGARRTCPRGGARPDRIHGGDLEGAARRGADRDGGARRRGRPRVHGRREAGRLGRADAPRARRTARSPSGRSRSTARSPRSPATATCTRARSPPSSGSAGGRRSPRR